jgi:glucose-1-phosphatase
MKISAAIYNGKREIKNIILDWGGVITELHPQYTLEAFKNLGIPVDNEPGLYNQVFIPLELGMISPDEFRNKIRQYTHNVLTDSMIENAWNLILGELPSEIWNLMEVIHKQYRTFLLSNTNVIHQQYYFKYLEKKYGTYGYVHLFEKIYFSFRLHLRKPDSEIFDFVIRDAGINPRETLFIDDSEENIDTANSLGFSTVHLKKPLTLTDIFENNSGLLFAY